MIFRRDFDGPDEGPRVIYVHGLGGSHLNWVALAQLLKNEVRATAIDLPGFGLTPCNGRSATVAANVAVLSDFLTGEVGEPAVLVGNSMGGLISLLTAVEQPDLVTGLVLVDPALPLPLGARVHPAVGKQIFLYGIPGLGEWMLTRRNARVPARQRVSEVLARCCVDAQRIPTEMFESLVELEERLTEQGDHAATHLAAARSIVRGLARPNGFWRRVEAIDRPVLLLHGVHDRLIPIESARLAAQRFPRWTFVELEAGHIPQMETPELVADEMVRWLSTLSSHR
jgi:pimeloyl-ACP methyl ester carboxylesterase